MSEWGRGSMESQWSNYCVSGGSLFSLSRCRRDFQDLPTVGPSSLFTLCRCISSWMASLLSRFMYPFFRERSFLSFSSINERNWISRNTEWYNRCLNSPYRHKLSAYILLSSQKTPVNQTATDWRWFILTACNNTTKFPCFKKLNQICF